NQFAQTTQTQHPSCFALALTQIYPPKMTFSQIELSETLLSIGHLFSHSTFQSEITCSPPATVSTGCAVHSGPLKRRRSRNPYHSASRTVTPTIDFPARILSGRLSITLRKMTHSTATTFIALPYPPKCHGPRSSLPARRCRATGMT